jgi:diguanylate cyclase (GGDEF)-like protein
MPERLKPDGKVKLAVQESDETHGPVHVNRKLGPVQSIPSAISDVNARLVIGLEAIIDAAAGILAVQSLEETLQGMADAVLPIVPYTSLAVYEVSWEERVLVPLLATGRYVPETLDSRPALDASITGSAVLTAEVVCPPPGDPLLQKYQMPGTPQSDNEAILVAPLLVGDAVVGTLNVWREDDRPWFLPEEALLLRRFASLAAMAYTNSAQREQLRAQALTDDLTGLFNRRHFERRLSGTLHDGQEQGGPTSLVYFDIDGFKSINDSFGHEAGDQALRDFAEVLGAQIRQGDIACRTGGEEFCVVLPHTALSDAEQLAWRVVDAVRSAQLGPRGDLTVSAGVATSPQSSANFEHLVRNADYHLLRAKREGRDRVVVGDLAPT